MQRIEEMLMELPAKSRCRDHPVGAIRCVLLSVHEDDALEDRLQSALAIARAFSAHLQLLHVVPIEAYTVIDTYGTAFANGQIVEALQSEAAKLQDRLEERLKLEDVSWNYEQSTASVVPELLKAAALSDLVVIGRSPAWHEYGHTGPGRLGAFLCSTRAPLCIPGDGARTFDPFGKAIIAWNGTFEAANAVRSSIGLLQMASEVRVVRFKGEETSAFPDTRLVEYLSRHGVHAEIETHAQSTNIAGDLINFAARKGAEYIVIGGYSHSRAGEFLFGGVTRELLRACPISLVTAH